MPEAADLEGALVAYLKTSTVLTGLLGTRVFAGELPASETEPMPRKAIVLRGSGGISLTGGSYLAHDAQRIDVFAFGETPFEAGRVMRAASLFLRSLRRSVHAGVLLHWANPASGASPDREPGTEWPRQFQSFQVMHGLEAVE